MKRNLIGAIVLLAAFALAGCNNQNKKVEAPEVETPETVVEEPQLPNRLLIIVDPQVDFTTGSLATANGPAAMDYLAKALDEVWLDHRHARCTPCQPLLLR